MFKMGATQTARQRTTLAKRDEPLVMLRNAVVLVALALATQSASSIAPADPSIGSYPWFVALDQRCPQKSASRDAALERYKRHLIANIRALAAGLPESQATTFLKRADELERTGPSKADLDRFADIFAKGSAEEIQELCQSFEADVNDRLAIERQLMQTVNPIRSPNTNSR